MPETQAIEGDVYKPVEHQHIMLVAKLGCIVALAENLTGPHGIAADRNTIRTLLQDPEVKAWLDDLRAIDIAPPPRA